MNKVLETDQELFISASKAPISLTVTSGRVAMKGNFLELKKKYSFQAPFFLYALERSEINLRSRCNMKISNTNQYYTNLYRNQFNGSERIIIVGDTDTGKSTLSEILLNLVNPKMHNFIDFDVGQNVYLPGTVTMKKFNSGKEERISFYFGHPSPAPNANYYVHLVKQMETLIPPNSGSVVNTCGWVRGKGLHIICQMVDALKANLIYVIHNEKVFERMQRQFSQRGINVVHLPKNPNVRVRNRRYRKETRIRQIKEYFIGTPQRKLRPFEIKKSFNDVRICVIGFPDKRIPKQSFSMLEDAGDDNSYGDLMVQKVNLDVMDRKFLMNAVLGVSHANRADQVRNTPIMGLVYIKDINIRSKQITFFSPSRDLPSQFLIFGSINFT